MLSESLTHLSYFPHPTFLDNGILAPSDHSHSGTMTLSLALEPICHCSSFNMSLLPNSIFPWPTVLEDELGVVIRLSCDMQVLTAFDIQASCADAW